MRKFFLFIAALCCAVTMNATGTMLPDSMITENNSGAKEKQVYTYDERGYQLTKEVYKWTTATPEWVGVWRYEFTYDANDRLVTKIEYTWNTEYNAWGSNQKDEYTYGENGSIQTIISYWWNASAGTWSKYQKMEYTYDAQGHMTAANEYDGDVDEPDYKTEYTYTDGNLTQSIESIWNGSAWDLYEKINWTYDVNGNQLSEIHCDWDEGLSEWVNWRKLENTYDTNGNKLLETVSKWNKTLGVWDDKYQKTEYTYDADGNILISIGYEWKTGTSSWIVSTQTTWYYAAPEPVVKTLAGRFAVSATEYVTFAQGNLRYKATTDQWCLANNQYDMIGAANTIASDTYSGWIDFFGFGTSGVAAKPWETSTTTSDYAIPSEITGTIAGTDYDWLHYNTIVNDGGYTWRLLSAAEWDYLLNTRAEAATKQGQAVIADIKGCILLPDNWTCPDGLSFTPTPNNYTANVYTFEQWEQLEEAGAVFLPATGYRYGTSMMAQGNGQAFYWIGDFGDNSTAKVAFIKGTSDPSINDAMRTYGCPIRPVRAATAEGIDNTNAKAKSVKVLRDGILLIEKNGKLYNAQGAQVK
jgi:hypothetical protein